MCWCGSIRRITRSLLAKAEADLADAEAALETSRINIPITSTTTASQLKSANSSRGDATAFLLGAERQLNAAQARQVSANAGVREAEANLAKANDDVRRYKLLVEKDEISRQQYDTAVDAAAAAQATRDARSAAVAEAEQNVVVARSVVDQAKAAHHGGGRIHRVGQDRAAAGGRQRDAREIRAGAGGATKSAGGSGEVESQLLHDCRSGHRHRRQEDR